MLVHRASATLEHPAYRRLTRACVKLVAISRDLRASQFRHSPAQLRTHPLATLGAHGEAMGETWRAGKWGGIMDKVERSFAAATAAGFVVLVIGVVLLALM